MSSNSFFVPSPTVILPPAAPDQYFVNRHCTRQTDPSINGIPRNSQTKSNAPPITPNGTNSSSLAGRKRSRGDIFSQDDDDELHLEDGSINTATTESFESPLGKPVHDPGTTGVYPQDLGYPMAAESQAHTKAKERTERPSSELAQAKRPLVTSRKSQRMNARASDPDDLAQLVLPPQMREATSEPLIDEATRALGISWTRMDTTEALQINQKAYGKWIQNHYPGLKDVVLWFENSAIPGYLVAASNAYNGQREYYIFSYDLTEARLVTTEPSQLVPRLGMLPALHLAAPGGHIRAETSPGTAVQIEMNGAQAEGIAGAFEDYQPSGACAAHAMELD